MNWSENNQNKQTKKKNTRKSVLSGTIIATVVYLGWDGAPISFCLCMCVCVGVGWKVNLFHCRGMDGVKKGTPKCHLSVSSLFPLPRPFFIVLESNFILLLWYFFGIFFLHVNTP